MLQSLNEVWQDKEMTINSHQEKEKVRHVATEKYYSIIYIVTSFLTGSTKRKTWRSILESRKESSVRGGGLLPLKFQ